MKRRFLHRCPGVCFAMVCVASSMPAWAAGTPLTTVRVASGLNSPLFVTFAPGDTRRVFIVEQIGRIRILDMSSDPPVLSATPFLDITNRVRVGGERGLLGLAFHPDFASNGLFYVDYTSFNGASGDTRVSQFHVSSATPDKADASSESILLGVAQPQENHNGGWIAFGPDGFLYIGMGDGGNFNDFGPGHTSGTGNGQDITTKLLGKMLRIDVNGDDFPTNTSRNYAIPPSNPFVGIAGDDEIWAYGLRNPWRGAFDSATGDLYIADVGQDTWEEIDFQPAGSVGGENWGWRCREGAHDFNFTGNCGVPGTPSATMIDPIYEFIHGGSPFRCSITGGEVYRGCAIPDLSGTYFFADFCSNQIWSFVFTGSPPLVQDRTAELTPVGSSIRSISSFGLDAFGEIYICDLNDGEVFKIVPDGVPSQCGPVGVDVGDDVCAQGGPAQPCSASSDCPGTVCGLKSRYISFTLATVAQADSAIRVKVLTLPGFPDFVGAVRWVGAPQQVPDENSADPLQTLTVGQLECEPFLRNWSGVGLLHVYGAEITPGATYEVRTADAACLASGVESCMSVPRVVGTGKWSDVVAPYFVTAGDLQPDFNDITSVVQKFLGDSAAPIKARSQLVPNVPFPARPVDFRDVSAVVAAFLGGGFSDTTGIVGPCVCPSTVSCGATACASDTVCGNGFCAGGFCLDVCGRCTP